MGVAAASVGMATEQYRAAAGAAVMRRALDTEGAAVAQLLDVMLPSPNPIGSLGHHLDIRA
jgi:Putative motility protein